VKQVTKERLITATVVAGIVLAAPLLAFAQTVSGGDAGTIASSLVTYLLGAFGIAIASVFIMIVALQLGAGRIAFEGLLIIGIAVALYFGGPGLIQKIASVTGGG
jgi:type IV secretory pathway VirB2 component (pilin)